MKDHLRELIESAGAKHWSFAARRDPVYMAWVAAETVDLPVDTAFPLRVWCATTGERPTCPHGQQRKLRSVIDGWMFCGTAGRCACAQQAVSSSVRASKALATAAQKAATQAAREATNLRVYGHRNSAQTDAAHAAHAAFYADQQNVKQQLAKQLATMRRLYGVDNPAHCQASIDKRVATLVERHGAPNPMQNTSIAARSLATRLANGYCDAYYRRNYDRLKARLFDEFGLHLCTDFADYEGTAKLPWLLLQCATCARTIHWRLAYARSPRCSLCNPRAINYKSKEELEVYNYVRETLNVADAVSGDRLLIAPYELDIVSAQHRVAIEYCGLYWHSEKQRTDRHYHARKLQAVEACGYRLLTIFSDEWLDHPQIIKSKISYLFDRIDDRRFARKLKIKQVSAREVSWFYQRAHIQGPVRASCNLALCDDDDKILSAMSFTAARDSRGLPENSYEMVRFASSPFVAVLGGASRLFSYFTRTHHPTAVVSYADRRISDGGLYRVLGFALERCTPPDYSYVEKYRTRHFRFAFRKDVLKAVLGEFDETEWEMMQALGYDRIWDCGKYRYVWRATVDTADRA